MTYPSPLKSPMARAFERTEPNGDEEVYVKRDPHKMTVLDAAKALHKSYHNKEYKVSRTGFHDYLAEVLDKVISGEWKRVMISAPPQHGKSQLVKYAIALAIARDQSRRVGYTSYGATLASEASLEVRDIVYSEAYRQMFGVEPHPSAGGIDNWKVKGNGGLRAVGVGGGLTGRSLDLAFIDDPHKDRAEANSETIREKVKGWYTSTLSTRFQGDDTAVCLILTRWHEDDLAGWLQAVDEELPDSLKEGWVVVRIPAIAEEGVDDPLGREPGEPCYPEKFSLDFYLKKQAGAPLDFEALYQGNPTIAAGDLFRAEDFQYYNTYREVPSGMIYSSWDTATKDKESNDLTAWIQVLIDNNGVIWVLDFGWGRWKAPLIKNQIEKQYNNVDTLCKFQSDLVLIEDKASGMGILQEFMLKNPYGVPVRGINPGRDDKVERSVSLQGKVAAKQVMLPKFHPQLGAWMQFFLSFPNGRFKDPVDAFTQVVNYAFKRNAGKKRPRVKTHVESDL